MKKNGILNPALNAGLSRLGEGHLVVIADCGLPLPADGPVVDLSLVRGVPRFADVLEAVLAELEIEASFAATEAGAEVGGWFEAGGLAPVRIEHEELKSMLPQAALIIRTGEATPFANVVLRCGVPVPSASGQPA
ncbi:D-ribose pyranase [Arthrobacter crystallopoietes BAB-32]|uniref:D-ribose pyranase n=1 Tax=Arthrobacter crystallopoietes BAB-32 TaxID=1246476 RepID=N1UPY0_9MICC|nr:D-ribose pyranase [Arthrobacter crystallopoietes]EMY32446.1 D-ribose pyranase [Arthrobacter crystallopoietes BAB-32]